MFIGHFGIGLGAKKIAPKISLGTLFLASQLLDLLWPTFLLLGWEHVSIKAAPVKSVPLIFTDYPISHSLLMACVWGLACGLIYFLIKRHYRGAFVIAICVVSHWILDLIVHVPDLPLYPGNSPVVGLGLWNHMVVAVITEGFIFIAGLVMYLQATTHKNKAGKYGFWSLIVFLVVIYLANLFGPPPSDTTAIAWAGEAQWLIVIWAYWADHNRVSRNEVAVAS